VDVSGTPEQKRKILNQGIKISTPVHAVLKIIIQILAVVVK
jgi:hypothetical protein